MDYLTHIKHLDHTFDFKINSLSYELMLGLVFGLYIPQERKAFALGTYSVGKLMGIIAQSGRLF